MKFIRKIKKSPRGLLEVISSGIKDIIDDSKERHIVNYLSEGLSNRVLFERFNNFNWPLWLEYTTNPSSDNCRACPNPLLLNTAFREWQVFTNYLSSSEIKIDRAGMISGPSSAKWSLELWVMNRGKLHRPQNDLDNVHISRSLKSGEIVFTWDTENFSLMTRIAGSRTGVDEALVSVELNIRRGDKSGCIFAIVRPYNNSSIGGVASIEVDKGSGLISVNGKSLIGFDSVPDEVLTGSGYLGDIDVNSENTGSTVQCNYGMATAALKYSSSSGKKILNFRIALNGEAVLNSEKLNYNNLFREFSLFTEMRLSEGIKAELPENIFADLFKQSKLSILNINYGDIKGEQVDVYRKLYFFIYAFCRSGFLDIAEDFFKHKLGSVTYDKKNPVLEDVLKGCFLVNSCYEIFIHKRETGFLQVYYPALGELADCIYRFSVNLHTANVNRSNIDVNSFAVSGGVTEALYLYSACSNLSYLSRCMGIFGDESKFKNESLRLQSLIIDSLNRDNNRSVSGAAFSLVAFPEKILGSIKNDEYTGIITKLVIKNGFPLIHPLYGIDMFSSSSILNQFLAAGLNDSNIFFNRLIQHIDDFYTLPEYIDSSAGKGSWGEGNSKAVNSILFAIMRNRLFIDGQDRLELFPVPDSVWFKAGSKIKVDDAASRYGLISFMLEILDDELRLSFGGSPKYLPPDILINIPYDIHIIPGDDFIVKKKVGFNYIISGWPSYVRFTTYQNNV